MSFIIKAPIVDGVVCPKNNGSDTLKSEEKSDERTEEKMEEKTEERTEERMEEKKKECVKMEISKEEDEFDDDDYDYDDYDSDSDENDLKSLIIRNITPEMWEWMKREDKKDILEKPKKKQKTEISEIDAYLGYKSEWTEESYKKLKHDYYIVKKENDLYEQVFLYKYLDNEKKEYIGLISGHGLCCGPLTRSEYDDYMS